MRNGERSIVRSPQRPAKDYTIESWSERLAKKKALALAEKDGMLEPSCVEMTNETLCLEMEPTPETP